MENTVNLLYVNSTNIFMFRVGNDYVVNTYRKNRHIKFKITYIALHEDTVN